MVFKMMQYSIRQEMKSYISKNNYEKELETVVIPDIQIASLSSEFKYLNEKEFTYKGKLYDIVKTKDDGRNKIFYCINDTNEERLFAVLSEHIKRNTDQTAPFKNKTEQIIINIIKEALPEKPQLIICVAEKNFFYYNFTIDLQEQFIPVYSLPPKS